MSTPRTPLPQIGNDKKPAKSGLTIGILCGVLGFAAVIIISMVVILKFRRKKKTRDEKGQVNTSLGSDALLLADGRKDEKRKSDATLSGQKSISCPDIYAVNQNENIKQSILLKLGSTAHAYEQLERDSIMGAKGKSEDILAVRRSASDMSLIDSINKISGDGRDGRVFDDDGHLYHTPSMLNTFRTKSKDRVHAHAQTSKDSSRDFLHPADVTVPAHGGVSGYTSEHEAYVTSYQAPSSNSPKLKLNTHKGSYSSENNNHTEYPGYKSPTTNSPSQLPKSRSFNVALLRDNTSNSPDDEDNIYDVPKLDDRDKVYTNLPAELLGSQGSQIYKKDDFYENLVNPRSYTMGSVVRKKAHDRDRVYEVPSSTSSYHSQPSLAKMTSEEKRNAIAPRDNMDDHGDEFDDDNTYDVPSRFRGAVDPHMGLNDNNRGNNSKVRDIINNMRDNCLVNDSVDNKSSNNNNNNNNNSNNNRCIKTENYHHEPDDVTRETTYDIPHLTSSSSFSPIDDDPYKNLSPTHEMPKNSGLLKKLGYDVPSTIPVFDPSQPSLLKLASKNYYKSEGSDTPYNVPSSVPDYDPSQAYSRKPINKKINNNDNRSKHYTIDVHDNDLIYDMPSSHNQTTSQIVPTTSSYYENTELSLPHESDDDANGDAIYQNIYQSEDGRTHLRTYVPT